MGGRGWRAGLSWVMLASRSAHLVGSHRLEQQRADCGPRGGGGGGGAGAGAGPALDQAGDLLVMAGADLGEVVVDDTRAGAAAEPDALGGGVQAGAGGVVGAQELEPERGPAGQGFRALPRGGVEVELERP